MTKVKVCGLTNAEDALAAVEFGADAVGFIFAKSPRRVDPETTRRIIRRLPAFVDVVGVFVNSSLEQVQWIKDYCALGTIQLHGGLPAGAFEVLSGRIMVAVKMGGPETPDLDAYPQATLLLDAWSPTLGGGTGRTFDWGLARDAAARRKVALAGGLTPENVDNAIKTVRPYAVDVSSGVEAALGRKDHERLKRFIDAAKSAA